MDLRMAANAIAETLAEVGEAPVGKSVFGPKVPSPLPSRIETEFELWFATTMSSLPSALKSPAATEEAP